MRPNNKKIIIVTVTVITVIALTFGIFLLKNRSSSGTGAILTTQPDYLKKEGDSANYLRSQLPYLTGEFTITEYSYSKGKFLVVFNNGAKSESKDEAFFGWLETSEFSPIPSERFEIK